MSKPLDKIDLRILSELQQNARITNSKLAEKIGLSAAACWERVKKLEAAGTISAYRTELALEKLPGVTNFVVQLTLETHRTNDFSEFENAARLHPNIVRCVAVGGGFDYLLEVLVPGVNRYQDFVEEFLEPKRNIKNYSAHIVTKVVKSGPVGVEAIVDGVDKL